MEIIVYKYLFYKYLYIYKHTYGKILIDNINIHVQVGQKRVDGLKKAFHS